MSTRIPPMDLPDEDPGNEIMFGNHTAGWYKWAAWFSQKVVASRAMNHLETPERAFAILCKGDELGLKPFAAWTWIYTTKAGRLAIMSKGALAVVQSSPAFAGYEERIEGEGKSMRAVAIAHRKGFEPTIKEFTYQDAEVAGLLKPGRTRDGGSYDTTYQSYLKDMLLARARGRALDVAFAAELGGIVMEGIAEDADEMDSRRTAKREDRPQLLPPRRDPLVAALAAGTPERLAAGEPVILDPGDVTIVGVDHETKTITVSGPPPAAQPAPGKPADAKASKRATTPAGPAAGGGSKSTIDPAWAFCSRCEAKLNEMGGCDVCGWPGEDIR